MKNKKILFIIGIVLGVIGLSIINLFVEDMNTAGEPMRGFYSGRLLDSHIEDACGSDFWCYTWLLLDTRECYFGEPCHIVDYLERNVTYVFYYEPFKNMFDSGDLYWDIRISSIYVINDLGYENFIWEYSGFEG